MARPYAAEHAAWFFLDLGAVYLDWHGYAFVYYFLKGDYQ